MLIVNTKGVMSCIISYIQDELEPDVAADYAGIPGWTLWLKLY